MLLFSNKNTLFNKLITKNNLNIFNKEYELPSIFKSYQTI